MTDVSIILVNYNTKDLTRECIKSIYEKTQGIEFEICVVDNNSSDDSAEMIEKEFPEVKLIKNPDNKGFGAANNIAIKRSNAKYVFCLNTDTILVNNAIKIMFDYMEKNQNVAVCGGCILKENLEAGSSYTPFPNAINSTSISWLYKQLLKRIIKKKESNKIKEVCMIAGADIFFRKSVLDEVGVFDEIFFMYSEEADLCYRIKRAGYNIKFIPDAKIIHFGEKSSSSSWKTLERRVISKYKYLRKNCTVFSILSTKISYIILHFLCYIFTFDKNHIKQLKVHYYEKSQFD